MLQSRAEERRWNQAGVTLMELLVAIIIFSIVATLLVSTWITLNRASVFALQNNDSRATARDALSRVSVELRDAQPQTMPTATPAPTSWAVLTMAKPMEADFYSAYNAPGANGNGSGGGALTRIYVDTSGSSPQKTLVWQRDTNGDGTFDRSIMLARSVVNNSIPNTGVTPNTSYTALFTYGYRNASGAYLTTDNSDGSLDLAKIISIQIRLIIDVNLAHTPTYVDLSSTVRPRNAGAN
jgi:prepilin-type N-terminal cleavage/methylation domain-containing protein